MADGDGTREINTTEDRASQPDLETVTRRASGDSRDGGRERGSEEDEPENRGACEDRGKGGGVDSETIDRGAGDRSKGAGSDGAGDFKTLDNGAGDRGKGAGRDEAGDRARARGATRPETLRPVTTRPRPAPPTTA